MEPTPPVYMNMRHALLTDMVAAHPATGEQAPTTVDGGPTFCVAISGECACGDGRRDLLAILCLHDAASLVAQLTEAVHQAGVAAAFTAKVDQYRTTVQKRSWPDAGRVVHERDMP